MLRTISVHISILVVAAMTISACKPNDVSGTNQDLFVGTQDGNNSDGFGNASLTADPNSTVTTASITSVTNYEPGTQEELRAVVGDRIFFDTDSSKLNSRAEAILDELARWMHSNPSRTLRIEGHADERGTREYNLALGDRRANTVVSYLLKQGVSFNRLTTISFGKERPVTVGSNPTAWTQNRRAVFRVK